jgi:hypothetical protein
VDRLAFHADAFAMAIHVPRRYDVLYGHGVIGDVVSVKLPQRFKVVQA